MMVSTYNNFDSIFRSNPDPNETASVSDIPPANYDEQLWLQLTQDFASLAYNVTSVAQSDSYGYGPAYLLNGISNTGYWYQVGISWNWPSLSGGHTNGFSFNYEFFYPNGATYLPIHENFSQPVHQDDTVLLSLEFSSGQVIMSTYDWNTTAYATQNYSAEGATYFEGCPNRCNYFFTGLMTEWYHVNATDTGEGQVIYSENGSPISSAWMCMDEYYTNGMNYIGQTIFSSCLGSASYYTFPTQIQSFPYNGLTESSDGYEFISG